MEMAAKDDAAILSETDFSVSKDVYYIRPFKDSGTLNSTSESGVFRFISLLSCCPPTWFQIRFLCLDN